MLARLDHIIKNPMVLYALLMVWSTCLVTLAFVPSQQEFALIAPLYLGAFSCYFLFLRGISEDRLIYFLVTALGVRFLLIFAFPQLSDDIYRFIWDGRLSLHGLNPYSYLPSDVLDMQIRGLDQALFDSLNSPQYYTVYPPIAQLVYAVAALAESRQYSAIIIKIILFLAECINVYLILKILAQLRLSRSLSLIYTLNPLIIIELSGNLHFEGLMISFILLCIYSLSLGRNHLAIMSLAMGVATKLLPLLFFPFIWKYLKLQWRYFWIFAASGILLFIPVIYGVHITNFLTSLDLYFGKFEFNASIYYLLRYIGKLLTGYNLIRYLGPLLGMVTIYIAYRLYKKPYDTLKAVIHASFVLYCSYIFCGTTIHPWYLSIPIMMSCFLPYRFVLLWSAMIPLTYINYSTVPYHEHLWIVGLEYIIVFGYLARELMLIQDYVRS